MMIKLNSYLVFVVLFIFSCQPTAEKTSKTQKKPLPPYKDIQFASFSGNNDLRKNKKIVLVSGDEEYRSEEALPQLAKILSAHHGFDCTVLFAQNPEHPGTIDPNYTKNIPELEALGDADLMILFTRFRALPDDQMQEIEKFLKKGKPIIGIRTATHAFNDQDSLSKWKHWGNYSKEPGWEGGFGRKIFGVNWHTHHGHHKHQSTKGLIASGAEQHPILTNVESGKIWGATDVYGVPLPMSADVQALVMGQVINRAGAYNETDLFFGMKETDSEVAVENPAAKGYHPNDPMMPVVWTKPYQLDGGQKGMTMTSTLGASSDLLNESLRRVFVNGVYHLLDLSVPKNAKVDLVGKYEPTQFQFHDDQYWKDKKMKVTNSMID